MSDPSRLENDTAADQSHAGRASTRPASPWATGVALLSFVAQRLAFGLLVVLGIVLLSYLGLDTARGAAFGPAIGSALAKTGAYVGRLARGDLGMTVAGSDTWLPRPVGEVILERLPRSLGLLGISLLLAALAGSLLGILSARGRSRRSLGILVSTLIGVSVPSFFAAFLLQWAATSYTRRVGRALLPVGGFGWDGHLVLPVLVLAARPLAQITRIAFVSVRQVLDQDYVRTAQGKGLRPRQILAAHVVRNAAIPILTTIGVSLRFSLSSLPVVELYFAWPGVGFTLLKGIAQQDDNLTIGLVLCLGVLFILVNLALELGYRLIDPRLLQGAAQVAVGERRTPLEALRAALDTLRGVLADNPLTRMLGRIRGRQARAPFRAGPARERALAREGPSGAPEKRGRSLWMPLLRNTPLAVGGLLVLGLVVVVFAGPQLAPNNPYYTQSFMQVDGKLTSPPFAPGAKYPWGTDVLGRDLMSLILSGAQQTLQLAVLAVMARTVVGVVLGAVAGWANGSVLDRLILGAAEVIAAFPTLLLVMILILALGIRRGMPPFIVALCFVGWGEIMQFVRGQVTALRPRPYVESAVAVGARSSRILWRHILPHLFSALSSIVALEMGAVLMLLGELGFISIFIGGGMRVMRVPGTTMLYSDVPEWGALLSNLRYQARSYPWTALYPMAAFFISILSFNLFGEGIRRLIDEGSLILNRLVNRYTVALVVVAGLGLSWLGANSGAMPFYQQRARQFDGERALRHVAALADPAMEGRALGTPGMDRAAEYIAGQFKALGIQPAGQEGAFFQERDRSFESLDAEPVLTIEDGGPPLVAGQDYAAYASPVPADGEASASLRYVALGRQGAPPGVGSTWRVTYPELERADFSEDILLLLSDRDASFFYRRPKRGALVVTSDPGQLQKRFTLGSRPMGGDAPWLWISEATAGRLLAGSGYTLEDLRQASDELPLEQMLQVPIPARVSMQVQGTVEQKRPVQNVVGYVPGVHGYDFCADCLGRKLIVVMAQYDSPPPGPDGAIYPAANDNASGVAVMLEAMRVIQQADYQPYKTLLFVAYSGEGLEGGEYVSDPDVKRFLQARASLANLELEAVVQLRALGGGSGKRLEVSGSGSLRLATLLESAARRTRVGVARSEEAIDLGVIYDSAAASQQAAQDVPVARLSWEGWEERSRLPGDTIDHVSVADLEKAGRTLALALMILGRETEY